MIARTSLDFFLAAVFLCKIPLETALSHNWYALEIAAFKASLSSPSAKARAFFKAVLIEVLKAAFLCLFASAIKVNDSLRTVCH